MDAGVSICALGRIDFGNCIGLRLGPLVPAAGYGRCI